MEALNKRASSRQFIQKKIEKQELSNILWAAFGVNRPERDGRTAPSAMDQREIDIYVVIADGTFLYNPQNNTLKQISSDDVRAATGSQDFVAKAPLNLVFVANYARVKNYNKTDSKLYAYSDCGFISQNVYLYCASAGLGTVVRAMVDREKLALKLQLTDKQEIIMAQTIGYEGK